MGLRARDCLMIGGRLATDITMGKKSGIFTALVLTGVTKLKDLKNFDIQPDYILESVRYLLQL